MGHQHLFRETHQDAEYIYFRCRCGRTIKREKRLNVYDGFWHPQQWYDDEETIIASKMIPGVRGW